jgi:hypothetical protein
MVNDQGSQRAREDRERRDRERIAATERKNAAARTPEVIAQGRPGPRYENMPDKIRKSPDLT